MKNLHDTPGIEPRGNTKWNTGIELLPVGVMVAMLGPGLVFSMLQAASITPVHFSCVMYPVECATMTGVIIAGCIVAIVGVTCLNRSQKT